MPARAVHEHDDEEIREFLGYMSEEQAHHLGIGRWQDQGGQAPHCDPTAANTLPHALAGHGGPARLGCPTPLGIIDPSKAPFILGPEHHRARVPRVSLLEASLDRLGEVFLNASCSAALACGWRGRGTPLYLFYSMNCKLVLNVGLSSGRLLRLSYSRVIETLACPSHCWTSAISAPLIDPSFSYQTMT
jgi:hypothetical protein